VAHTPTGTPVETPPHWVVRIVEFLSPGFYARFFEKLVNAIGTNPIRVTSWYRTPLSNQQVGGDPLSQHLVGFAMDVVVDDPFRMRGRFEDMGLTAVVEGDHVHVQVFPAGVVAPLLRAMGLTSV